MTKLLVLLIHHKASLMCPNSPHIFPWPNPFRSFFYLFLTNNINILKISIWFWRVIINLKLEFVFIAFKLVINQWIFFGNLNNNRFDVFPNVIKRGDKLKDYSNTYICNDSTKNIFCLILCYSIPDSSLICLQAYTLLYLLIGS